ncbi:hypothetical protein ERX37_08715 [Macrococcus hajekii]|uniref:Uncharacterized protein n=1 Tax=Macrococcus hajekii TaxID=198482 RepID=A0A4R6BIT0_9STAP|nr:hypothetical protein [Macrococcus hajekii]TDM01565.1 hypothetical protein ERX37_08715 [Macrococcus hajekii]GGB01055.1 hypothetical protein GCM10007190_06430 [Macrococcus hajekii]
MLSKILSLNNGLFRHFFNNNLIFMIINIVCTFFLIPFGYIIFEYNDANVINDTHLLGYDSAVLAVFFTGTLFYSVLSALGMTYLWKSEEASDFMHSIPFTRSQILSHMLAAFLTAVTVNLIINGLIISLFSMYYDDITIQKIADWILLTYIISLFTFIFTLFVGQIINHYFGHLVLTGLLLMLPIVFHSLASGLYSNLFRGSTQFYYGTDTEKIDSLAEKMTFPISMVSNITDSINWFYFGIVMIIACLLLALTYYLYQHRRNERIVHSFQNPWMEWAFITLIVLLGIMVSGAIFTSELSNLFVIAIIYFLAFIIIYLLAQSVNQRSPRIRLNFKSMALTFVTVAVILIATYIYSQEQEKWIPQANDVESVRLQADDGQQSQLLSNIKDPDYIREVIQLHQEILNEGKGQAGGVYISYKLKDGSYQQRYYSDVSQSTLNKATDLTVSNKYGRVIAEGYDWDSIADKDISIMAGENTTMIQSENNADFINAFKKDTQTAVVEDSVLKLSSSDIYIELMDDAVSPPVGFNLSPYQKNLVDFMKKEKLMTQMSDIYNADTVYQISKLPAYDETQFGVDENSLKNIKVKTVDKSAFDKALNEGHADINGQYIYAIGADDMFVIIKMNKEVK